MQARMGEYRDAGTCRFYVMMCEIVSWADDQLFQIILWITVILVIRKKVFCGFFFFLAKPLNAWHSVTLEGSFFLSAENQRGFTAPGNTGISQTAARFAQHGCCFLSCFSSHVNGDDTCSWGLQEAEKVGLVLDPFPVSDLRSVCEVSYERTIPRVEQECRCQLMSAAGAKSPVTHLGSFILSTSFSLERLFFQRAGFPCSRSAFLCSPLLVILEEPLNFWEIWFARLCSRDKGYTSFTHQGMPTSGGVLDTGSICLWSDLTSCPVPALEATALRL